MVPGAAPERRYQDGSINRNKVDITNGSCQHESCRSEQFVEILNEKDKVLLVLSTASSFARVLPIKI